MPYFRVTRNTSTGGKAHEHPFGKEEKHEPGEIPVPTVKSGLEEVESISSISFD
jgi:hypothetical protein